MTGCHLVQGGSDTMLSEASEALLCVTEIRDVA